MSDRPLVTIVTMVLNGRTYLDRCLDSVLRQTYQPVEHVIVDGASTDGTVELLERYARDYPGRVRFLSEPDRGSGDAWNKGLKMAKGDILGWLGCDDMLERDAIAAIVEFLIRRPNASLVYGGLNYIDGNGTLLMARPPEPFNRHELINERNVIPALATFYRREVMETLGGVDLIGNDFEFFVRASAKYEFHRIDRILANFRIHPGSATTGHNSRKRRMWMREDIRVSREHGGRWFSGYLRRYYRYLLIELLRPFFTPVRSLLAGLRGRGSH